MEENSKVASKEIGWGIQNIIPVIYIFFNFLVKYFVQNTPQSKLTIKKYIYLIYFLMKQVPFLLRKQFYPTKASIQPFSLFQEKSFWASRTFAHRILPHDWYFNDACQLNRPFQDFIFPALFFIHSAFEQMYIFNFYRNNLLLLPFLWRILHS